MAWEIIALASAVSLAVSDVYRKKVLLKEHAMEFGAGRAIIMAFLALLIVPWVDFSIGTSLLSMIFAVSTIAVFGQLYNAKALRHGRISVVVPFMNLELIMILVVSFLLLGESPSFTAGAGVFIIALGAYAVNISPRHRSLLEPLRKMAEDNSFKFLLMAVFLISLVNVAAKYILTEFQIHFATYLFFICLFSAFVFVVLDSRKYGLKEVFTDIYSDEPGLFLASAFFFLSLLLFFWAVSIPEAMVALVLPLRRTSALFSTLIGGKLFREENLYIKIFATIIMIAGVVLIVI